KIGCAGSAGPTRNVPPTPQNIQSQRFSRQRCCPEVAARGLLFSFSGGKPCGRKNFATAAGLPTPDALTRLDFTVAFSARERFPHEFHIDRRRRRHTA